MKISAETEYGKYSLEEEVTELSDLFELLNKLVVALGFVLPIGTRVGLEDEGTSTEEVKDDCY